MSTRPLSPEEIRNFGLTRTALGRRGYAEEEVDALLDRIADEAIAAGAYRAELLAENHRLKAALRDWQDQKPGASPTVPVPAVPAQAIPVPAVPAQAVPGGEQACPIRHELHARVDAASRNTGRIAEYVGGHYEQVRQAAHEYWQDGADPHGPQASALETWMSWARAVLGEVSAAQEQLAAVLHALDAGCAPATRRPQQPQPSMVSAGSGDPSGGRTGHVRP